MYTLPREPGSIGYTLDAGFKLLVVCFKHTVGWTFLSAAMIYVPVALMSALLVGAEEVSASLIMVLIPVFIACVIAYLIVYLAVVHRVGLISQGRLEPMGVSLSVSLRRTWRVILAGILYGLAVMGGMMLFVVPGMILMLSMGFYMFCILLDDDGVFEALGRSHKLVWGKWWRTAVIATVVTIVYVIIMAAAGIPIALINQVAFDPGPMQTAFGNMSDMIAGAISAPMWISVFIVVYHDLKLRTEGQDLEARVEALATSH